MRDYYLVLGVDRSETPRGIRAAFLEQAKRHHPDRAGQAATPQFQSISEAYQTLADPERRQAYDERLGGLAGAAAWSRPEASPPAEPIDILDRSARFQPSFDDVQARFLRNFVGEWRPKAELVEGLNIEVVLTTAEVIRGLLIPLEIPTLRLCATCGGTGFEWPFACTECRQTGRVLVPETIRLRVPPLVRSGTIYEVPLDPLGIHNFFLRVHVLVDDSLAGQAR